MKHKHSSDYACPGMWFFQIIKCVGMSVSVSCPVFVSVSVLHRLYWILLSIVPNNTYEKHSDVKIN